MTKRTILLFFIGAAALMITACGGPRHLSGPAESGSAAIYAEAGKALDSGNFRIDIDRYYNTARGKSRQTVGESFIRMESGTAEVSMAEDLYKGDFLTADIYSFKGKANIRKIREPKKGNRLYEMEVRYGNMSMAFGTYRLMITLFRDSSECYVEIYRPLSSHKGSLLSFSGTVESL